MKAPAQSKEPERLSAASRTNRGVGGSGPLGGQPKPRKTGTATDAPRGELANSDAISRRASVPFALGETSLFDAIRNSPRVAQQKKVREDIASSPHVQRQQAFAEAVAASAIENHALPSASAGIVQAVWADRPYTVSSAPRNMRVDTRAVHWGGTNNGGHANHPDDGAHPRAILFETMCRNTAAGAVIGRLDQAASLWDTGLSITINSAYTPNAVYNNAGAVVPNTHRTLGQTQNQAEAALNGSYQALTNNWNGMPIRVITAAWERREIDNGGQRSLEQVQGSVPYSTFRTIAATNAGPIDTALRANHQQVWHKMGDDDMPYVDPNAVSPETTKLQEVEDAGQIYNANTMVTFGYDLATPGTQAPVTGILAGIYRKEMELRDAIAALGAPMYPSEPTTFYRPRDSGTMDAAWNAMEQQNVGGSGQQLEGAKLVKAMNAGDEAKRHYTYHTTQVETGAGARNDALIALFNQWLAPGQDDPNVVKVADIEARINQLDQSALRHDEYLSKVAPNLGGQLSDQQHHAIEALVTLYRREAAEEAAQPILVILRQRWYGRIQRERWAKYDALPHNIPAFANQ